MFYKICRTMHKNDPDGLLKENIEKELAYKIKLEKEGIRDVLPNYKVISDALDEYYCLNKLRVYCSFLSQKRMRSAAEMNEKKSDFILIDVIVKNLKLFDFNNRAIEIYVLIKTLFEEEDARADDEDARLLENLESLLIKNKTEIHPQDRMEIFSFLTNFCTKKINLGKERYRTSLFRYNNEIINIKFGALGISVITPAIYKNMVKIALRIAGDKKLFQQINTFGLNPENPISGFRDGWEWTEKFIEAYYEKLDSKNEIYHAYCRAYLEFKRHNYQLAYDIIGRLSRFRGIFINLDMKMLQLMVAYEMKETGSGQLRNDDVDISKTMEAFRALIRDDQDRKKQLSYQLIFYKTFFNFFKRLYWFSVKHKGRLYNASDVSFQKKKDKLKEEMASLKYVFKHWMLEKLEEI